METPKENLKAAQQENKHEKKKQGKKEKSKSEGIEGRIQNHANKEQMRKDNQKAIPEPIKQATKSPVSQGGINNANQKQKEVENPSTIVASPAATPKQGKHNGSKSTQETSKKGSSKGPSLDANTGHQPKMKKMTMGNDERMFPKEIPKTPSGGIGKPRKIEFGPQQEERRPVPENANALGDTVNSVPGEQGTTMAVDQR
ncbi:unnamed protein product [Linum trigynum]|uniref:Uncharacterized protein n=1 Tax=Linum trigynum TaxID=586398 RepID=A0AAV2D8B4_9ROSI